METYLIRKLIPMIISNALCIRTYTIPSTLYIDLFNDKLNFELETSILDPFVVPFKYQPYFVQAVLLFKSFQYFKNISCIYLFFPCRHNKNKSKIIEYLIKFVQVFYDWFCVSPPCKFDLIAK